MRDSLMDAVQLVFLMGAWPTEHPTRGGPVCHIYRVSVALLPELRYLGQREGSEEDVEGSEVEVQGPDEEHESGEEGVESGEEEVEGVEGAIESDEAATEGDEGVVEGG